MPPLYIFVAFIAVCHAQVPHLGKCPDVTVVQNLDVAKVSYPPDSSVPAKLAVEFNGSPRVPYWIVDTDYDNYSLVWSCTDLGGFVQADFAWILSRTRTLDSQTVDKLIKTLGSFGVNTSSFRDTVQDNCPSE